MTSVSAFLRRHAAVFCHNGSGITILKLPITDSYQFSVQLLSIVPMASDIGRLGTLVQLHGTLMPIIENDPWREQYFARVPCSKAVVIPTDDGDAYDLFPNDRWVYNKLLIAESQGIRCAPHGLVPPKFPVFSKPIYNMRGMGTGSCIIRSQQEWHARQAPGHMWMEILSGEHLSTDVAVVDGDPVWWRHASGKPLKGGMFD